MIGNASSYDLMIDIGFSSDKIEAPLCFGSVSTYTTIDQLLNEYPRGGRALRRNEVCFIIIFSYLLTERVLLKVRSVLCYGTRVIDIRNGNPGLFAKHPSF